MKELDAAIAILRNVPFQTKHGHPECAPNCVKCEALAFLAKHDAKKESDSKVTVEQQPTMAGWAVFSHIDGDPDVIAFLPGCRLLEAEAMLKAEDANGEALVFDGGVFPAVVVDGVGFFVANHGHDEESIKELCDRFGGDLERSDWILTARNE